MESNKSTLLKCIVIPLVVGGAAALLSAGGMSTFAELNKPPLSPPGWLFPIVWTVLYILMGIASYLVYTSLARQQDISAALIVYGLQLVVNFLWPIFFFDFGWYLFSFFWLLLLWALILKTIQLFARVSETAAKLMIPYLVWVAFAGYLNLGIWWLN